MSNKMETVQWNIISADAVYTGIELQLQLQFIGWSAHDLMCISTCW